MKLLSKENKCSLRHQRLNVMKNEVSPSEREREMYSEEKLTLERRGLVMLVAVISLIESSICDSLNLRSSFLIRPRYCESTLSKDLSRAHSHYIYT